MPLRPEDARFAAAVDLLLLEKRTRVGLILRSPPYLVEVRFETLLQHVRTGPSVVELQVFSLGALPPLFLDHQLILQRVLRAEREGQLPLLC